MKIKVKTIRSEVTRNPKTTNNDGKVVENVFDERVIFFNGHCVSSGKTEGGGSNEKTGGGGR